MSVAVKICGLSDPESVDAAIESGADYLGFVFFENSPRHVAAGHVAVLTEDIPDDIFKVGLFVNPTDDALDQVLSHLRLDYLQLHGDESPQRIDEIRQNCGLPVIKAIGVAEAQDVASASQFTAHADMLLFDAKPPANVDRPGGNAESFQWDLMPKYRGALPWLLAGGLTPENVAQAIKTAHASGVDVSSGVESAPGQKDPDLIKAFIKAAKGL